jgi:dipeptidyl aminopeptidase/acylaminoacyl peptidase
VHDADRITRPVLVIYGLDDDIVAPEQAETIVQALRRRGVPVTQLAFSDEGHDYAAPTASTVRSKPNSASTGPFSANSR